MLDLGEWLGGTRAIPAGDTVPEPDVSLPEDAGLRH
jgi:endogenous inhibitor of DNA gyrase (YacG/DUF329 family)